METQTTETITFEQRVDRLANHLLRAGKGHQVAILFAVYVSEFARAEAEKLLEAQLQEAGEKIVRVRVQPEGETVDLPLYLRNHPQKGQAIFFIYNVSMGGDATQQYLNYRREFLVEDQQRLLFWLHENEIGQLARNAPDFWAFRGRTLEFLEQPSLRYQHKLAEDLVYYNWQGDHSQSREDLDAGIRLREELLAELPDQPEFTQIRAEILYALSAQYAMIGNLNKAIQLLDKAESAVDPTNTYLLSRIFSSRGIAYNTLGQYDAALVNHNKAIQLKPEYASAYYNRGVTYQAKGEYETALADYNKAIMLKPDFAFAYNNRGNVYKSTGNYRAALADYNEAIMLKPDFALAYHNRGVALRAQEQFEDALSSFNEAIRLDPSSSAPHFNLALLKMKLDKQEEVLQHLQQGLEIDANERQWVSEHPTFAPLRDDARFRALVEPDAEDENT